jgi:hypothetical protein
MILYPEKLSFKIDGGIKVCHDKQKLRQYMTTIPPLQKILKGILCTEDESKQKLRGWRVLNHKRRKDSNQGVALIWLHNTNP